MGCLIYGVALAEKFVFSTTNSLHFNSQGNPYVDPADLTRGTGNKYPAAEGGPPREKIKISQAAWDRVKQAMDGTVPMTTQANAEELMAYQYSLSRVRREIAKATTLLDARKAAADESSRRRAELSNLSSNSGANNRGRNDRTMPRMNNIPENNRGEHLIRDLDLTFMSVDSRGHITPKTPEAAYTVSFGSACNCYTRVLYLLARAA